MIRAILLSLLFVPSAAFANGQGVGSGGEVLRELFNRARVAAGAHVDSLQWCSFDQNAPKKIVDLVLEKRSEIKKDIATSPYLWVVDTQPTCAFTQQKSGASIYLSYPTCASTVGTDLDLAMFTVLHETAHHFGIADEGEADLFARIIMAAEPVANCPARSTDFWDKNYCSGKEFDVNDARRYLAPGKTEAVVSELNLEGRIRTCTQISGCGSWSPAIVGFAETSAPPTQTPYFQVRSATATEGFYGWAAIQPGRREGREINWQMAYGNGIGNPSDRIQYANSYYVADRYTRPKSVKMTESCAWFNGSETSSVNQQTGSYTEYEWVLYSNF